MQVDPWAKATEAANCRVPSPSTRRVTIASLATMVAAIAPVHLFGALAPEIQDQLNFGDTAQGMAVAAFFALSAVLTSWGGSYTDRAGPTRALRTATLSSVAGAVVIMTAPRYGIIVVGLLIAAIGNAISQPGNSSFISLGVPTHRRGIAMGIKQSAIPVSTGLAGLALPAIAVTAGWRWAYLYAVAAAVVGYALVPRISAPPVSHTAPRLHRPSRPLMIITIGAGASGIAVAPIGAFLVRSLEDSGFEPGRAGIVQLCGSVLLVSTRIGWGRLMDGSDIDRFRFAAGVLLFGSIGYPLLSFGTKPMMVIGAMIAYGAAWSWAGVVHLGVVERHAGAAGGAAGVLQAGMFVGAMLGPGIFGIVADNQGFATGWMISFTAAVSAAGLLLWGGDELRRQPN